jgi:hypothetical protein
MTTGPYAIWYLALLLPVLVLLGVLYYRRTVPEVPASRRRLLLTLRVLALAALALALARPVFEWERRVSRRPVWVRLVDYSSSMDRTDGSEPGTTRLSTALALLEDPAWHDLASKVELQTAFYADSISADTSGLKREGTDLALALAHYRHGPRLPSAVILISDGAANAATDPASEDWPFPVYSICLGDSGLASDRALVALDAPAVTTAGDSVAVSVRVAASGEPTTAVFTFSAGEWTQSRTEHLAGKGRQQELQFTFRPDSAGVYRVSAEVARAADEATTANNRMETKVFVEPRRRRILLLALAPDWETAFVARRLASLERVELAVRYRSLTGRGSHLPWPATFAPLAEHDAVLLADMAPAQWVILIPLLERYLTEGSGGLLFMLGPRAASGEWGRRQDELVGVRFVARPPGVIQVAEPVRLSSAGRYHPVATPEDGPEDAARVWAQLPLLSGILPAAPSSGAVGLVETQVGTFTWPVLVAGHQRRGRVLTALGYPLWRWDFALAATPDKTEWAGPFWQSAMRWLTSVQEADRLTTQLLADPVPALSAPEIVAVLLNEAWQPDVHATLKAEVRTPEGELVQTFPLLPRGAGRYRGRGRPLAAGEYRYVVHAQRDTLIVAESGDRFSASLVSREALTPASQPGLLEQLSASTGGSRLALPDWGTTLLDLPAKPTADVVLGSLRLWESPWLLALVILLYSLEWILRRRYQML